jgi:hypothetical protein
MREKIVMTKIVLDSSGQLKLDNLTEPVEICDAAGRSIGIYCPLATAETNDSTRVRSPHSVEEIQRRRIAARQQSGKTWAEIKAKLDQIAKDEEHQAKAAQAS